MKIIILRSGIFWKKWGFKILDKKDRLITRSIGYNDYTQMFLDIVLLQVQMRKCLVLNKYVNENI